MCFSATDLTQQLSEVVYGDIHLTDEDTKALKEPLSLLRPLRSQIAELGSRTLDVYLQVLPVSQFSQYYWN